jgi:hypothetical protein
MRVLSALVESGGDIDPKTIGPVENITRVERL